jgi:multicomponent Na+:H+ antiporter subunit D
MALLQDDMRRLLSYHIQSQVGYMVAGVGLGGALATAGAFGHVFNHILYKSLLFMTVGVVIYRTGKERLSDLGGLASEMPITAVAFFVAALSIAGFPGFNGFVSKGMVIGAAHKKHLDGLWYLLLAGGVGTFLSFIKLGYHAFLHGEYDGMVADANRGQTVAMGLVAGLCVLYGVYPQALYALLPGSVDYHAFTVGHVVEGLVLAAIGVVGFALLKNPLKRVGRVPDVDRVYDPVVFYGSRALVVGVTELFAVVDRLVVGLSRTVVAVVRDPGRAAGQLLGRDQVDLRADIGTSILLVTAVLVVALIQVL